MKKECNHTYLAGCGDDNYRRCIACDTKLKVCSCGSIMRQVRINDGYGRGCHEEWQCYKCLKYASI